jgi:ADP-heptose:LPS heptosyltransferase
MGELGELFAWMEQKYKNCRILVECVEGTLLPSPQKIQYHFPKPLREKLMNHNYLDLHHMQARVPLEPRVKFYPNEEEKAWANKVRSLLQPYVVVLVPTGSSITKKWPYIAELAKRLLEREDVSVVVLGDERDCKFEEHPRLLKIGTAGTCARP